MESTFYWPAGRCLDQVKQRPSNSETIIWPEQPHQSFCLVIRNRCLHFAEQNFQSRNSGAVAALELGNGPI
jgi:hypothetical protein